MLNYPVYRDKSLLNMIFSNLFTPLSNIYLHYHDVKCQKWMIIYYVFNLLYLPTQSVCLRWGHLWHGWCPVSSLTNFCASGGDYLPHDHCHVSTQKALSLIVGGDLEHKSCHCLPSLTLCHRWGSLTSVKLLGYNWHSSNFHKLENCLFRHWYKTEIIVNIYQILYIIYRVCLLWVMYKLTTVGQFIPINIFKYICCAFNQIWHIAKQPR